MEPGTMIRYGIHERLVRKDDAIEICTHPVLLCPPIVKYIPYHSTLILFKVIPPLSLVSGAL